MNEEQAPGGISAQIMQQGIELLRAIDDPLFVLDPGAPFRGGIGGQFRHCFEFYDCFLKGLEEGAIDYTDRARNPEAETDRACAVRRAEELVARLSGLDDRLLDAEVKVKSEQIAGWSRSTFGRELHFLMSHTIHHYALIISLVKIHGFDLGPKFEQFGVAPSTIGHWSKTPTIAG